MTARHLLLKYVPALIIGGLAIAAWSLPTQGGVSFHGLGTLPGATGGSRATDVSADGSVVVGKVSSNFTTDFTLVAFRWTQAEGMVPLLGPNFSNTQASRVSPDGSVVVGVGDSRYSPDTLQTEGFRWSAATGVVGVGNLPAPLLHSWAQDASAGGAVVVGTSSSTPGPEAFRWTQANGIQGMGDLPGGDFYSEAYGVSADGSVIVGSSKSASGYEAYRWTQTAGMVGLGDLPGGPFQSGANAVSHNGEVVVGFSESEHGIEAFRWTQEEGMLPLGNLFEGQYYSVAEAVSNNGSVVVGFSRSSELDSFRFPIDEAFIWDSVHGMRSLRDVLINDYGMDLAGWKLTWANGISDDGRTIVGEGLNPDGYAEAWVATIPEPATLLLVAGGLATAFLKRHPRRRLS